LDTPSAAPILVQLMPRLRRLLGDDQVAQLDAFVADVDARSGHELGYCVLDGMVPDVDYAAL